METWTCVFPRESFQARNRQTSLGVAEKRVLAPGQRTQESGELLLQGLSLFGVSGGQSKASQLVETAVYYRNIRGNRKRLGRGKGRSLKSTHLAKSETLIIRIFTLRTLDYRNKNAGNRGKALKKIKQEEIK